MCSKEAMQIPVQSSMENTYVMYMQMCMCKYLTHIKIRPIVKPTYAEHIKMEKPFVIGKGA